MKEPVLRTIDNGIAVLLPEPVKCSGCGRIAHILHNRMGQSRCIVCDAAFLGQYPGLGTEPPSQS